MWNDYGARWLDLQRGVFVGIDPIADKFAHVNGYNYAEDNPISAIDLWGLQAVRTTKVQQQLMTNLNNSKNLDVHTQTACYPTTWKRVSAAYKDAGLNAPAELKNKGTMVQDRINPDYGRWWPTGSADFTLLAKSGIENKKWADLPEKYRGEGFPGAMAYAGFADDPQNAWDGNLQPEQYCKCGIRQVIMRVLNQVKDMTIMMLTLGHVGLQANQPSILVILLFLRDINVFWE